MLRLLRNGGCLFTHSNHVCKLNQDSCVFVRLLSISVPRTHQSPGTPTQQFLDLLQPPDSSLHSGLNNVSAQQPSEQTLQHSEQTLQHSEPATQHSELTWEGSGVDPSVQYVSPFNEEKTNFITNLVEPSFKELGLGHGWPSGMAQTLMELFHIDLGLPWWQVIGATTVVLRFFVFPLVVISQRNTVTINNHQPEIQKLQIEAQLASVRGEQDKARFATRALNNYFHTHECHPSKALWPIICQSGFFTSMFFALRGMTGAPVPSLTTGGLLWFQDLTLVDPTYILPVLTSATIYLQLYLGADGLNTANVPPLMKKIMYILPLVSLPIMTQFPAALNLYWLSNNIISVGQARIVRIPAVRAKFGIGEMKRWTPDQLPMTNFVAQLNREMELQRKLRDKEQLRKDKEKKERLEHELKKREELLQALRDQEAGQSSGRAGEGQSSGRAGEGQSRAGEGQSRTEGKK